MLLFKNVFVTRAGSSCSVPPTSLGSGVAPLGADRQHTLHGSASVRLGDVCGRHAVDHHHHPLLPDPVQPPTPAGLRSLAPGGKERFQEVPLKCVKSAVARNSNKTLIQKGSFSCVNKDQKKG